MTFLIQHLPTIRGGPSFDSHEAPSLTGEIHQNVLCCFCFKWKNVKKLRTACVYLHIFLNTHIYIVYIFIVDVCIFKLSQLVQGRFLKVSKKSENYTIQKFHTEVFSAMPSSPRSIQGWFQFGKPKGSPSLRTLSWGDVELDFASRDRDNRLSHRPWKNVYSMRNVWKLEDVKNKKERMEKM